MGRRERTVVISERPIPALCLVLVGPALDGTGGQGEIDVAPHVPVELVFVNQFGDEFGSEGDKEGLK